MCLELLYPESIRNFTDKTKVHTFPPYAEVRRWRCHTLDILLAQWDGEVHAHSSGITERGNQIELGDGYLDLWINKKNRIWATHEHAGV